MGNVVRKRVPVFKSVQQAYLALERDKLATVYRGASTVFVATAFGTGTFGRAEWDRCGREREAARAQERGKG